MHVRVRLAGAGGAAGERVVALESRLTSVERFRRLVRDKFSVPPARQRLFYGGKLLENGYTFHDYNIKLNDVIQLMVQVLPQDENDVEKSDVKKSEAIVYEDTKSNLYEIGDLIDMRDQEQGAWFEGSIIGIVKDPHYKPFKIDTSKQNGSKSTENGETCDSDTTSLQKSSLQAKQNGDSTNLKSPTSKINRAKSPTAKKNGTASPTNKKNGLNSPNASSSSPGTPSRKRGITDYFSKTPKSSNVKTEEKENGLKAEQNGLNGEQNRLNGEQNGLNSEENVPNSEENGNDSNNEDVNMDTDVGILYKVNLIYDDVNDSTSHYCKLQDIRPRARSQVAVEDLKIGQKVMINHNTEEPNEKGYWYDFTVKEIRKHRKSYELVGTLYLGPEAVPQHDTSVKLRDKIYAVQEVVPLAERTEEERRAMVTALEQRPLPLHCTTCRDNEDAPCRECGCYLCSGKNDPEKIILCDECNHGFHMACLDPPMTELPEEDWYCSSCKRDPNDVVAPGAARQTKKANHSKDKRDWGRGMACVGKTQTCAMPANHFGPIPGVEVGMAWRFRIQLSESGVHRPPVSGIHGRDVHGAYSLVLSGGYEDDVDNGTEFTYTGSGGRDLSGNKRTADQSSDQTLTRENKSLARNCAVKDVSEKGGDAGDKWREGRPVRVVRSYKMKKHFPQYAPDEGIRYDGIYKVVKYYPETGKSGFRVWKYLLRRDDPSPAPWDKDAKKYSIIYPAGYLEAEAEKKALKEHKLSKTSKKRVLKESNYNEEDADESITESPPMKKRKTRTSKAESSDEDTPLSKRKRQSSKNQTSPKSINPFTLAKVKMPNSSEKSKLGTKSANKSPIKSPTKKLENILTEEELEVIKADKLNSKLWEDCLSVCKTGGKKQLIEHVTQVFLCIICQDVAANPVTTKCQHNFCMSCLKLAFKSTGSESCSHCRQDLSKDELEHNGQLKTALRTLMPGYDIGKK